jgi:hypothetical protein
MVRAAVLLAFAGASLFAGSLYLEISDPHSNAEAKAVKAVVIAQATACHEPGKSVVRASFFRREGQDLKTTDLKIVPLKEPGIYAVVGDVPAGAVIDIAVTNPEYKNYEPRVLIPNGALGPEWASVKHFFSTPPQKSDIAAALSTAESTAATVAHKR